MSLAIATTPITSAGTKQFSDLVSIFTGYQVKDTTLENKLYTEGSSAYPATVVGTATATIITSRKPLSGDLYETVFNPADTSANIPLVGQSKNYTNINATAINGGAKWTVAWNMTSDNWFSIVVKSTGTSVAGKLKIRSSASNESVCTFTTSATANTWERKTFNFKTNGATGVTFTGTPVFTAITEIEVTLDAVSQADVALVYGANNLSQLIGAKISIAHPCVSEFAMENTLETVDFICGQQAIGSTGTSRAFTIKIASLKKDIESQSLGMGDVLKVKSNYVQELVNDTNIGNRAFSAGALTIATGQIIARIYVDGVGMLKEADSATTVPEGAYHYNSGTGVITVNVLYNGKVPTIYIWNNKSLLTSQVKNLELGYVGYLSIPRKLESGKYQYNIFRKAQVMMEAETMADDGDKLNFMYKVYPINGLYADISTEA